MARKKIFRLFPVVALAFVACDESNMKEAAGRLGSDDPGVRLEAVRQLCDSRSGRTALAEAVGPGTGLDMLAAAAADEDCFAELPPAARARYLLEDERAAGPVEGLAALGTGGEPILVAALGSTTEFTRLRAARAMLARHEKLGQEARVALLDASAALVAGGLDLAELGRLGDEVYLGLLRAMAGDPDEALLKPVEAWWGGLDDEKRGRLLGESLRIQLTARKRNTRGAPAWALLTLSRPSRLAGVSELWLRTATVRPQVDGKDLAEKSWPMGLNLGEPRVVNFEMGTVVGATISDVGMHSLRLVFSGQLLKPKAGAGLAGAGTLWSGEVASGEVSFEIVAKRPDELIEAIAEPDPDPAETVVLGLLGGGKRIELWPVPESRRALRIDPRTPRANIKFTSGAGLSCGLAFDVMAGRPGSKAKPAKIGTLVVPPGDASGAPVDAGSLDLSGFFPIRDSLRESLELHLELVPSVRAAYRNPAIESFWDRRLDLGVIELKSGP